ncbi:hypothetical protein [Streptomyces hainanensis]|uniref:GerMN domain-containing protein n=1 Tax=Streptomyces hainanensis TaxID=402648 RepID=A0A4R4TMU9_9ACTN|nr:hypothetical protein [Streptomyces hainanensis]TDC76592.1 hypothetical protein E1283_09385 [Streptomyces hainanensis]
MRRRPRPRPPALVALSALAAPVLGGCGVPETDVIAAGAPATVEVYPYPPTGIVLFFRSPEGRLMPVIRFADEAPDVPGPGDSPGVSTQQTVAELFVGPLENEREAGLVDGLPEFPFEGIARTAPYRDGGVEVTLPIDLRDLDDLGVRQVVCTIAFTEDAEGRTPVRLRGIDTALPPAVCDVDADAGGLPVPTDGP